MKYIKSYNENFTDLFKRKKKRDPYLANTKYKVGDYVLYDPFQLRNDDTFNNYVAKIVDFKDTYTIESTFIGISGSSGVVGSSRKYIISQLNDRDFERALTPEELDEFCYQEDIKRYNL